MGLYIEKGSHSPRRLIRNIEVEGGLVPAGAIFWAELLGRTKLRITQPQDWADYLAEKFPHGVPRGLLEQIPSSADTPRTIWAHNRAVLDEQLNALWLHHRTPVYNPKRR